MVMRERVAIEFPWLGVHVNEEGTEPAMVKYMKEYLRIFPELRYQLAELGKSAGNPETSTDELKDSIKRIAKLNLKVRVMGAKIKKGSGTFLLP